VNGFGAAGSASRSFVTGAYWSAAPTSMRGDVNPLLGSAMAMPVFFSAVSASLALRPAEIRSARAPAT